MFTIQTLNSISRCGLDLLPGDRYAHAPALVDPDAILVRSADMHAMELPASVKAVARVGVGVNNIPVDRCSERGVVVFSTPGANANGVKELVIMALIMCSRSIPQAIAWAQGLKGAGAEVPARVEQGKSKFIGPEIKGKRIGVIGLGAIGVMVANDAVALGMQVSGRDPFISADAAGRLSREVKISIDLDSLLAESDYITLHIPQTDETKGFLNRQCFSLMKKGVRILNFSRAGLVDNADLVEAIRAGTVATYVTDFPEDELLGVEGVIPIPHLGASTPESEDNCAIMAVRQLVDFLENGNIVNSANFPDCTMPRSANRRIVIANRNVPNIIGQFARILAQRTINIGNMLNKSKGDVAYNIIDIDGDIDAAVIGALGAIDGVVMVRAL